MILQPENLISEEQEKARSQKELDHVLFDQSIQQQMQGVHVIEAKNDEKEWELWAEKAIGFRQDQKLKMQIVKALFFGDKNMELTVRGREGYVEPQTKNMFIEGDVVTQSNNGYVFRTQSVLYNSESRQLHSPHRVEVVGPKDPTGHSLVLRGEKMESNLGLGLVTLQKNVLAEKSLPEQKRLKIKSDQVEIYSQRREVRFLGGVKIDMNGMEVSGPDALFKYGAKSGLLEAIEVTGGVRAVGKEKWATSDRLNIMLNEKKFVFSGQPKVYQESDELHGEEIVFLDSGRQVQIKNAKIKVKKETLEKKN